jgi:putative membrane protein
MEVNKGGSFIMLLAHDHWFFWPIIPLLWFGFVVLFFGFVARRRRGWWDGRRSGEAVLAERFARGEIPEEEYRSRLTVLREGGRR